MKLRDKARWWLNHPWEIPIAIDLWLISPYPVPKWRRAISGVMRQHPETLESPPGWSPKPWKKKRVE